jgi:hypothetical protein
MFALVLIVAFAAPLAMAQEAPKAKKYEDPVWYSMTHVKYKPGRLDDAMKMIKEYFEPASVEAGTPGPAMVMINHTGEWDLTIVWKMKGGLSAMEWETSPEDVKWMSAMHEMVGGGDKAKEIMEQYQSLVSATSTVICRQMPFGEGGSES